MPQIQQQVEQTSSKIDIGVYLSKVTITNVIDRSDFSNVPVADKQKIKKNNEEAFAELCLELVVDSDGLERKIKVFGNVKKDVVTGKVKTWNPLRNGVQKLLELFYSTQEIGNKLNDDYSMTPALLSGLIGRDILRISYVTGTYQKDGATKLSYRDFNTFWKDGTDEETIISQWNKAKIGLKDYKPELVYEFGGESAEVSAGSSIDTTDKDIPF